MIKRIYLLFLLLVTFTGFAFDFEYSIQADKRLSQIELENNDLRSELIKLNKAAEKNIFVQKKEKFESDRFRLFQKFPAADFDAGTGRISYIEKIKLQGKPREFDHHRYKNLALDFLDIHFPEILNIGEQVKILHVREDYGAVQQKRADGSVSPEVNVVTYSYCVTIGRTLYDKPIFNSYASIEIDATTEEIVAFDFKNWKPLEKVRDNLSAMNRKQMMNLIAKHLQQHNTKNNEHVKHVVVEDIIPGWVFAENSDSLVPAFMHYGNVDEINSEGISEEKYYTFIEILIDEVAGKGTDDVPVDIGSQVSRFEEPVAQPETEKEE